MTTVTKGGIERCQQLILQWHKLWNSRILRDSRKTQAMGTEPYEEFPFINAKNNNGNAGESQSSAQDAHRAKSCTYLKQGPSVALSMPWGAQGCARPAGSAQSGASPAARGIPAPQHKPRALHSAAPALTAAKICKAAPAPSCQDCKVNERFQ